MAGRKLLYEAGAKKVYDGDSEDQLIVTFTDQLLPNHGGNAGKIKGKGSMNNTISSQIFEYLESYNVMTCFLSKIGDKEMQIKNTEILPFDIIILNAGNKNLSKRFGIEEGEVLNAPVIEYYYRNEKLKLPMVNESHLTALGLISQEEIHYLNRTIPKVNAILKSYFERRNMVLASLQLSLGRYKGYLVIADEISPDTCQFWGIDGDTNINKDMFRMDKGPAEEVYNNIVKQINIGE